MSLLNRPSDGLHSVLVVVFKLLLKEKEVARDRLIALCGPAGAVEGNQVRQTLNTWLEFGLFEEDSEKGVMLHADVRRDERDPEKLGRLTRRLVLRAENNPNLWAVEKAKAADFTRALCWLLAQDVYTTTFSGGEELLRKLRQQLPRDLIGDDEQELRFVTNTSRWPGLKAWCVWFGFGWSGSFPNKVLVLDPTSAVRDTLPAIFPKARSTMAAHALISALAQALPVLDGGTYRMEVENRLREQTGADAWVPPPNEQVSTSLSRAILRLQAENILRAEEKADWKETRVRLTGRNQALIQSITHFSYHPKAGD